MDADSEVALHLLRGEAEMTPDETVRVRALIAKWNEWADNDGCPQYEPGAVFYGQCADELQVALNDILEVAAVRRRYEEWNPEEGE